MNANAQEIASLGMRAILYEVSATPKPGLVDRNNSGAHRDMDFYTFMASAAALGAGFEKMARTAWEWKGNALEGLLESVRPQGVAMEQAMFHATEGINTHKGMIFNIGLLVVAASYFSANHKGARPTAEVLSEIVSTMTQGICKRELGIGHSKTKGEKLYLEYGTKGVRGEAETGYGTVLRAAVPIYRTLPLTQDRLFLHMLFGLMAQCEDSNVLARHTPYVLRAVQEQAQAFLTSGGMMQHDAFEQVLEMDCQFIKRNISPGGAADLLAVAIFMGLLEGRIK